MNLTHTRILLIPGVSLFFLVLTGCPGYGYKYDEGKFPDHPVNLAEVNSEYDDYNATSPVFGEAFPLVFSSNRNSEGGDFDFVYYFLNIVFSRTSGFLTISAGVSDVFGDLYQQSSNLEYALERVNTGSDELGPYALFLDQVPDDPVNSGWYYAYLFLYSTGISGNQDIWFTHNLDSITYAEPKPAAWLNSGSDDGYPCLNGDRSAVYFCSDRAGKFDIYTAAMDDRQDLAGFLDSQDGPPVEMDTVLSSAGNDKCPYIAYSFRFSGDNVIQNNLLVFASDREGGYGGYDLYYSKFRDGTWSEPVNFGPVINSEFNEYRPIVRPQDGFSNDFMLFSSDRPGGKGGYDLYYVGIADIGYPL